MYIYIHNFLKTIFLYAKDGRILLLEIESYTIITHIYILIHL